MNIVTGPLPFIAKPHSLSRHAGRPASKSRRSTDPLPTRVVEAFRTNRVVILDGDLTPEGVPSIRLFPDQHLEQVLTHLTTLGHRCIDCINAQQHNPEIDRRIALWRGGLEAHGCTGRL